MSLGIYFAPVGMTTAKYNECIRLLKQAGAAHPAGRSYHSAFGPSEKLMVFDVWTSQAAFDKFGKTLMPILQQLGIDSGKPDVMAIHNVITPPRRAATPKKRAAKRAAPKRGKKKR